MWVMNVVIVTAIFGISSLAASELEISNSFENGQATSANAVNANFDAIKAAVNDNNVKIENLYNSASSANTFVGFSSVSVSWGNVNCTGAAVPPSLVPSYT